MGVNEAMDAYTKIRESYKKYIINENYKHLLELYEDKDVFFKIVHKESGKVEVKYLLGVGNGCYQDLTPTQLEEIKKKFGDSEKFINSKNREEISNIVNSFNSLHQPVLI